MSVDVDARSAVQDGPPVVRAVQHLGGVGRVPSQRGRRDIDINGRIGTRLSFGDGSPTADTQLAGRRRLPYQIPRADALFAIEPGACTHDFIANAGLQALR